MGTGALTYVGPCNGDYVQATTYRYVGWGGDFARTRRDFTCLLTTLCLLLLLVIPLLFWLLAGWNNYDCQPRPGSDVWLDWSLEQQAYCCHTTGIGCTTPPTQPSPSGPVDPYNCAVGAENTWAPAKSQWCCRVHSRGCPTQRPMPTFIPQPLPPLPPQPPRPADPYNCADGYANWQAGWSAPKKVWCCKVHGRGCPGQGCAPIGTTSPPFDCEAGYANWMAGWSAPKKDWCCKNTGKGCGAPNPGGC